MPATTKKIPLLWIVTTALVCIVVTRGITLQNHSTNKETLLAFKRVDSNLMIANRMIVNRNRVIAATWHENMKKPELSIFAMRWSPKIDSAIELTNRMVDQIEKLKHQLKKEAGLHEEDSKEISNEDAPDAVKGLMIKKGEGEKLKNALTVFERNLLSILSEERRKKMPKLAIENLLHPTKTANKNNWAEVWLKNIPTVAALALLNKFENDVLLSGNLIAEYCGSQVTSHGIIVDEFYEGLTNQNSTYFLPGQTLKIKAGIGAFITWVKPIITIDGIKANVSDYGYASYSKVVSGTGGSIPVSISFTNPNTGLLITRTTVLTYKVGPPK